MNFPRQSTTLLAIIAACSVKLLSTHAADGPWRISTFAGNGTAGYSGDGGPATKAQLNNPFGIVRGPDGAIYFCEYDGNVVRRVDARGVITTVAGNGKKGYSGDAGPATEATFNQPHEIRFDHAGNLFLVDMLNSCVRRVDAKTRMITTFAGTGQPGYSGDGGSARAATFNQPHSIQLSRSNTILKDEKSGQHPTMDKVTTPVSLRLLPWTQRETCTSPGSHCKALRSTVALIL